MDTTTAKRIRDIVFIIVAAGFVLATAIFAYRNFSLPHITTFSVTSLWHHENESVGNEPLPAPFNSAENPHKQHIEFQFYRALASQEPIIEAVKPALPSQPMKIVEIKSIHQKPVNVAKKSKPANLHNPMVIAAKHQKTPVHQKAKVMSKKIDDYFAKQQDRHLIAETKSNQKNIFTSPDELADDIHDMEVISEKTA